MGSWFEKPPIVERHANISVVREDLVDGGSKARFLPFLIRGARHIVFGGPFCGGAPYALSVVGRRPGIRVTLFYAQRKRENWHPNRVRARENGATIFQVPCGYMTNVQKKARTYARQHGALFLPLGFDVPQAAEPYVEIMRGVRRSLGTPDQIWCATGSGMLARCLGVAFPESLVTGVSVGLGALHRAA
jgi:hypothetical protein